MGYKLPDPSPFAPVVQEMTDLIRYFKKLGAEEYDEVITQAEEHLKLSSTLVDQGMDERGVAIRLQWSVQGLRALQSALKKGRPVSEVAKITGYVPGSLHNYIKAGKLKEVSKQTDNRLTVLQVRAMRRKEVEPSSTPGTNGRAPQTKPTRETNQTTPAGKMSLRTALRPTTRSSKE